MARLRALSVLALLAVVSLSLQCACHLAFSAFSPASSRPLQLQPAGLHGHAPFASAAIQGSASARVAGIIGAALGVAGSISLALVSARQKSRIAAKANPGSPSLIQVLEQKGLLSAVERLGLLSQAESAGLGIQTVEELGLLKLAEDLSLLSLAENVLTNGSTPFLMLAGSGVLGYLTYLDVTAASFDLQWVIAGALGAPAVVLAVAGLAIFALFGGARRTRDIDQSFTQSEYGPKGFATTTIKESVSLINVLEKKKILSFLENNRLLTLAASLVNKPLTLTQNLRVLSTLERQGLLSQIESSSTDTYGAASYGFIGALFLTAAVAAAIFVPGIPGLAVAALAALPGLVYLALAIGLGLIQSPRTTL